MKKKRFGFNNPKYIAFFLSLLALALFIFSSSMKDQKALSLILTILGVFSLVIGFVLLYLSYRKNFSRPNFFLYDRRRKTSITIEALTFDFANDNLSFYLSSFTPDSTELWSKIPRELIIQLQADPAFVPLVAFKMLHDVSIMNEEDILPIFLSTDERTVAFVCRALKNGGEREMADFLFDLKKNVEGQEERVVPFFQKNKLYFEAKAIQYIRKNIEKFDFED